MPVFPRLSLSPRGRARALVAGLALAVALALIAAPSWSDSGSRKSLNVGSTGSLIGDYATMINARVAALGEGTTLINRYVAALDQHCSGVLGEAPMSGSEAEAIGGEISGAIGVKMIDPVRPAMLEFVHAVGDLLWSDSNLAHAVGRFAGAVLAYARLPSPNLCGDLRAWKKSGYKTVPVSTDRFNAEVSADDRQQSTAIPGQALAPYETKADAAAAAAASATAAGYGKMVQSRVGPPLNRLLLILGVH